jgi:hypothetical protein
MLSSHAGSYLHSAGVPGVCFQVTRVHEQDFYGIIFEDGAYDRLSAENATSSLDIRRLVCSEVADYKFHSVWQLKRDYHAGKFVPAFARMPGAFR